MSTDIVNYQLTIDAPRATIFELLTEADGLLQWIAIEAVVEPEPGGVIAWTHENGQAVEGRFLELDRPGRLVFTYGWRDNPTIGPGATLVEVTLVEVGPGSTRLTLVHRELPEADREDHLAGWRHFLDRLAAVAGGG